MMMMMLERMKMMTMVIVCVNLMLLTSLTTMAISVPNKPFWELLKNVNYLDGSTNIEDATLSISAMGRPLHPGSLYNALTDQLVPGIKLWTTENILKHTRITPKPMTMFNVAGSESLSEKTSLLGVEASIKTSFLAGRVQVGGATDYLNEKMTSNLQCSVSLQYHQNTQYKELLLTDLPSPDVLFLDKMDATHVVVAVMYGANSIMEFQQTASDVNKKQDIQANLNMMVKLIPFFEISGEGTVDMTTEQREMVKEFSCKFFGDVLLDELPSTYEEAVNVYKMLPSLVGKNGEMGVPLQVWLYPLSKLVTIDSKLKEMIAETLVVQIEKTMDDLDFATIRANDLLKRSNNIKVKDIIYKLEDFQRSLEIFTTEFTQEMSKIIPGIRAGEIGQSALTELLKYQDASGFSGTEMKQWLDSKETELNAITMYMEQLETYELKPPGLELDTFLLNPDVKSACMFSYTSLDYEESYLNKTRESAEDFDIGSPLPHPEPTPSEEEPWYRRPDLRTIMRESTNTFNNECEGKRIVSYVSDPNNPVASIRKYAEGVLVDSHLQAKNQPFNLYTLAYTFNPDSLDPDLILSEGNRRVRFESKEQPSPGQQEQMKRRQVMSREPLKELCYLEVEWSGWLEMAVAYQSISRDAPFKGSPKAWSLSVENNRTVVSHGDVTTELSVPLLDAGRVGLFLNRKRGSLFFFTVSSNPERFRLLHRFKTHFTHEDLHVGFYFGNGTTITLY